MLVILWQRASRVVVSIVNQICGSKQVELQEHVGCPVVASRSIEAYGKLVCSPLLRAPLILSNTHHGKLHALLHDLLGARARLTSNEHEHLLSGSLYNDLGRPAVCSSSPFNAIITIIAPFALIVTFTRLSPTISCTLQSPTNGLSPYSLRASAIEA